MIQIPAPTPEGFLAFLRNTVGITVAQLPDNDIQIGYAYSISLETVLCAIKTASPLIYMLSVYNLATDLLINWANDQLGQTFFTGLRTQFSLNSFVAGVISSSADESTSESLIVPDSLSGLTIGQLQNLKTPYGRQYLSWAQMYGTNWGLS